MKLELNKDAIPFLFYGDKLENTYRHISEDRFDEIMNKMWLSKNSNSRRFLFSEIWALYNLDVAEIWVWSWYNAPFYKEAKSIKGIDISENMLEYAEQKFWAEWISNYKWVLNNSDEIKDQEFDLVILTYTLTWCKDSRDLFKQALEKTKSWWRIAILDTYNFDTRYNTLMRIVWWHQAGAGIVRNVFDIFYAERRNFKILTNKRLKSEKNNTEYILILEKL